MKRIFAIGALMIALGLVPAAAHAALITTQTFCVAASNPVGESTSCPDGLGATLQLDLIDDATNTYTVTLTLDTTSALFTSQYQAISGVEYAITGVKFTDDASLGDYEAPVTLGSAPGGVTWLGPFFDKVNNGTGCDADKNNSESVCTNASNGIGTDTGDVDTWVFNLNLDDSLANLTANVDMNLRAVFLGPTNTNQGGTILSPDFNDIPTGTTRTGPPTSEPDTTVPEPTSLILLGSGLAYVGTRLRRRRSE